MPWDATSSETWAKDLGLVPVPLFSQKVNDKWPGSTILLDGQRSSFTFLTLTEPGLPQDNKHVSWAWSSNIRHIILSDEARQELFWQRWDSPDLYRKFRFPTSPKGARELLALLEHSPSPTFPDSIQYVLKSFRRLRETMASDDPLEVIRAFNLILSSASGLVGDLPHGSKAINRLTLRDLPQSTDAKTIPLQEWASPQSLATKIGDIVLDFVSPVRYSDLRLMPSLLLRHAAGQLYQEAHLLLEKDPQMYFPELAPGMPKRGDLTSGVRFTPQQLARFLVQQALLNCDCVRKIGARIEILDPACGSGVFLIEAIRELELKQFKGEVHLRGFDKSPVAHAIAEFCVSQAISDRDKSNLRFKMDIRCQDALTESWGSPDVILMNPPFRPWQHLESETQSLVREAMGDLPVGHSDIAMAFVAKAVKSLKPGGALGTVLPSPALETKGGINWRCAIQQNHEVRLIGNFRGYGYFRESLVAPAFLVLHSPKDGTATPAWEVETITAEDGYEDIAIRSARLSPGDLDMHETGKWAISRLESSFLKPESWNPRTLQKTPLVNLLKESTAPIVCDLFDVHQGILTGSNTAFILTTEELSALPRPERRFFLPVASSKTIWAGAISPGVHVFYPYIKGAPAFDSEPTLRATCPEYFKAVLIRHKEGLSARPLVHTHQGNWWELNRPRLQDMWGIPKFVSKFFGLEGAFALDMDGKYAVVMGHFWAWKDSRTKKKSRNLIPPDHYFAYLALLNSPLFEALLSLFCPKVQGGQYDLSKRHVDAIPIPNLLDLDFAENNVLRELDRIGKAIHNQKFEWDFERHLRAASLAYRVSHGEVAELIGR